MMLWVKDFVRKYPSAIVHGCVPLKEVAEQLLKNYGGQKLPAREIPDLPMHLFNAVHLPVNDMLQLSKKELSMEGILLPITAKTRQYVQKDYVPISDEADYIYLAYEEQTRYFYSNSNMLFLEVAIAAGVSEADIQAESEDYIDYLITIQRYIEGYGSDVLGLPIVYPKTFF